MIVKLTVTGYLKMNMKAGSRFWFPCEVKPGAFSDELMVRVPLVWSSSFSLLFSRKY
jgi:hypothetical protein